MSAQTLIVFTNAVQIDAVSICGLLRHSWLENQVINKTADDVAFLWNGDGWPAVELEFPRRIHEARHLADTVVSALSPRSWIGSLDPFRGESSELIEHMKEVAHERYLECTGMETIAARIRTAVDEMDKELNRFILAWKAPKGSGNQHVIRAGWRDVVDCASVLHSALREVPKGIVLP